MLSCQISGCFTYLTTVAMITFQRGSSGSHTLTNVLLSDTLHEIHKYIDINLKTVFNCFLLLLLCSLLQKRSLFVIYWKFYMWIVLNASKNSNLISVNFRTRMIDEVFNKTQMRIYSSLTV